MFIRGKKLNIFLVFITQPYFKVPQNVGLNTTHFVITKIPNKKEFIHHIHYSSDISTKYFIIMDKKYTAKSYSFSVNGTTLSSDNPLRFRKKFFNI